MKNLFHILIAVCFFASCKQPGEIKPLLPKPQATADSTSSSNPLVPIDLSPMDITTYPDKYAIVRMARETKPEPYIRIIYSRPHKKHRVVFGESGRVIVPYGKQWRLGANEATEIEFFTNVVIGGKNVARGRYTMYAIPYPDKWTIALNKSLYNWGLQIDPSQDVLRTDIAVQKQEPAIEDFTMFFEDTKSGAALNMAWDNTRAVLYIDFTK